MHVLYGVVVSSSKDFIAKENAAADELVHVLLASGALRVWNGAVFVACALGVHADFKIDLKIGEENEKIEVIRWQFPLLHGMLRTAYSAQGLTLDGGVLVDLRRAGGLEDDDWWLAIYVMLTRARKLENLILLGMTDQVEDLLRRGPPAYLRELTDKLEAKGAATLERLQNWPVYESLKTSWHLTLHLDSTACRRSDLLE